MSLRVRKLARELEVSPDDLLRLLREMGFERYRTPEDLVADDVVARVRRTAVRQIAGGRFQAPPRPASVAPPSGPRPAVGAGEIAVDKDVGDGEDWMSRLVPGVLRAGEAPRRAPPPAARRAPGDSGRGPRTGDGSAAQRPPAGLGEERAESAREALATERRRLEAVRDQLVAERTALEQERAAVAEGTAALAAERAALEARVTTRAEELRQRSLLGLLEERGLSGLDECERAVAALAAARALGRLLGTLVPTDPDAVRRLLAERLVLVAGPVTEDLGPTVQVAPARADVRGGPELERQISRLGAALLLEGYRRVVIAGVPPRLQTLMTSGMDPRVELTFRPGGARDELQAAQDVARGDLVVTWNVDVTPAGRTVYAESRKRLVELRGRTMSEFLDGWYASHRTV